MLPSLPDTSSFTASSLACDALGLFFDSAALERLPSAEPHELALLTQFARSTNIHYNDELVRSILGRFEAENMKALQARLRQRQGHIAKTRKTRAKH